MTTLARRFTTMVAMVAMVAMMMVGAIVPAAAQMDSTPASDASPAADLSEIAAPDTTYGRVYQLDTDALKSGTPSADLSAMPPIVAMLRVNEFASADDASAAIEPMIQALNEQLDTNDVEMKEIQDLGDQALQSTGAIKQGGINVDLTMLGVQQDNVLYIAIVGTFGDSSADVARSLVDHMMTAEPGDGDVTFHEDGSSTGGYFNVFPAEGDDLIQGMIVSEDMYSAAEAATPAS